MIEAHKAILEGFGHTVYSAQSGEEGVEKAIEILPDLILMDIVMPNMNGFQATRKITKDERTKHIPVVILSTKDQETDIIWGKKQGAKGYLVKPVDKKELASTIDQLLEEANQ